MCGHTEVQDLAKRPCEFNRTVQGLSSMADGFDDDFWQLAMQKLDQFYVTSSDEFSGEHLWSWPVMSFGRTGLQARPVPSTSGRDWSPVLRPILAVLPTLPSDPLHT